MFKIIYEGLRMILGVIVVTFIGFFSIGLGIIWALDALEWLTR